MAQTAGKSTPATALDSINRILLEIISGGGGEEEEDYCWDPPRRFSDFAKRLQHLVHSLSRSADLSSPAVSTSLRGIAADLDASRRPLSAYRSRSRIYVLVNCIPLCSSLRDLSASIASWLALLDSSLLALPDLRKKAADLSADMQNPNIRATENEERVYCTLQKESKARQTSKAVQSAIVMDLARALGMNFGDHGRLSEQIKLLRSDLVVSSTVEERRILMSLEKIFDSWSATPCVAEECTGSNFEEDAQIPPFKNFLCPLTKEVMKDPVVVVESSQTYERTAIEYWFNRCLEDALDPTCPVTGQVLENLELKPNIGLKGAIEEWVNRNIELQINSALNCLREGGLSQTETTETMLDNVYRISEEYPESRYMVRNAGVVSLVVRMLKDQSKRMRSQIRCKALMAMFSMAKDEESKIIMVEEGMTRLAIRSLTASLEKEREYALRLLLEFSSEEGYCRKLALEKGALVLISSMTTNLEYPTLSNLAEEILKNMEMIDENVEHLAMAGRYQPLLTRLCKGTEDVKVQIAILLGKIPLTNNGKDYIARKGGQVLVDMLSSSLEGRESSLQALNNLSTLDDNATLLVDFGLLPALTDILFATDWSSDLKVLSASTIANILSNSGHWELSPADKDGHPMQSEFIIRRLLELLTLSTEQCQASVIHILCGIAASPQASDLAATHIRNAGGIAAIVPYFEHMEPDLRTRALKLVNLLSEKMGQVLVEELREANKLPYLKEKLLDPQFEFGERAEIVCILARLPFSVGEVKIILGPDFLRWAVSNLKEQKLSSYGKNSASTRSMVEGLLGLLLHYARSPDPEMLALVQEYHFMSIFREHISNRSHERAKQNAALGLKYLSESSRLPTLTVYSEPQPPGGFCFPLVFICSKKPMAPVSCPLHGIGCEEGSSFCLLKGNAIKPLVDLLNDENTQVQIAAVEALSTVVSDVQSLKNAAEELKQLGLFDAVIRLFKGVRPGELQERLIAMVENLLRVEAVLQDYSADQHLIRALVEALGHGNANTKRHAQDALTNLRQISGVGTSSNPSRGKKT